MWAKWKTKKRVYRFDRVEAHLPVTLILGNGHTQRCQTVNFSNDGLGLRLSTAVDLIEHEPLRVLLHTNQSEHVFDVRLVAQRGLEAGVQFLEAGPDSHRARLACTFERLPGLACQPENGKVIAAHKGIRAVLSWATSWARHRD